MTTETGGEIIIIIGIGGEMTGIMRKDPPS
jgi:hypothetical protein